MIARKTPEQFQKEFDDLVGNEYTLLDKYELSSKHVRIIHNVCGHTYTASPNMFLRGNRCPYCHGNKSQQKTTEQFKKEVYNLVKDEYTVLGEYINRAAYIHMRHNKCGREYDVTPGNFLCGTRCTPCQWEAKKLSQKQAEQKIKNALGDNYKVVSKYTGVKDPLKIKHLSCGRVFEVALSDAVYKHSGCRACKQSRGEDYIYAFLKNKGIKFVQQKRFKGLKDIKPLSFDFYIPSYRVLIEYQGEQHFHPKTFGGVTK